MCVKNTVTWLVSTPKSIVLLKNTSNALPLKKKKTISVFGLHVAPHLMSPNTALTVMSGVVATIDGPAMFSACFLVTTFQVFNKRAQTNGFMLK